MSILILAEHDNDIVRPSTHQVVSAAAKLGTDVHLLVVGFGAGAAARAGAAITGVTKTLLVDAPYFEFPTAENLAAQVIACIRLGSYTHVVAPASGFGKNVLPRVAALLGVAQVSDIVGVVSADVFIRPIYAGSALATVRSDDPIRVVTIRSSALDAASSTGGTGVVESLVAVPDGGKTRVVAQELTKLQRPELGSARVVVSGGRALGSAENFTLLEQLAEKLNAAIGASRAAVDAGYVTNDYQVGQTGKIVAPELYIAVGISGAIQHLAGMKDSRVIVAINKDADAPIFQVADYGLVGDLFDVVPELVRQL